MLEGLIGVSLQEIIQWGGLLLLFAIVFAETGLLIGFFLPGDSLLFTAGLLAAAGYFNIWALMATLIVAAIVGDQVGYLTGKHLGRRLFSKPDSRVFKKEYLRHTEEFYAKHGNKTIVLARWVPIVRTFAPIVAGVGHMNYRQFVTYNVVGGITWVVTMVGAGYYLVKLFPPIEAYLHYVILCIIILSVVPIVYEWWKARSAAAA